MAVLNVNAAHTDRFDVVVVGSLNVDLVVHAPRLPLPGETLIGDRFATDQGGKGGNQAVAAARMGARVAMLGRVGDDTHGTRLVQALKREGIECGGVSVDNTRPSGVASIMVANSGENCIVVVAGANHGLMPAHVEAHAAVLQAAKVVVAQLETPLASVLLALRLARQGGATTVLNAAPAATLSAQQLSVVDWLVVNESEAQALVGLPAGDAAQARLAALALRALGPRHVVVTLGGAGLVHAAESSVAHHAAAHVQAVDATGAGDTFVGALAACLASGELPEAALQWGQAAAAVAVTRRGAQSAMPSRAEVRAQRAHQDDSGAR